MKLSRSILFFLLLCPVAYGASPVFQNFNREDFDISPNGATTNIIRISTNARPVIVATNVYITYNVTTNLFVTYNVSSNIVAGNIQGETNTIGMFTPDNFSVGPSVIKQIGTNSIHIDTPGNGFLQVFDSNGLPFVDLSINTNRINQLSVDGMTLDVRNLGKLDPTGVADNTIILQSALNSAANGIVYLPVGTFKVTSLFATNVNIRGVPNQTILLSSPSSSATLTLINTNENSNLYAHQSEAYGLVIDGRNNPNGTGLCIGTNASFAGNYTGNLTVDQFTIKSFTNGVGLWLGNTIANTIQHFNFGSNYHAVVSSSPIDETTTTFRDGVMNWSLDWAMELTNFSGVFENTIFEANKKGIAQMHMQTGFKTSFRNCHSEANWTSNLGSYTNAFSIEVYVSGVDTFKRKLILEDNTFNELASGILWTTNIGQINWGPNFVFAPQPYYVTARGPFTRINATDFPDFARSTLSTFFYAPEVGAENILVPMPYDTNQFSLPAESSFPTVNIRGYVGNGSWLTNLQVYVPGITHIPFYLHDIDTNGNSLTFILRGDGDTNKVILGLPETGSRYLSMTPIAFTLPGSLTVGTNITARGRTGLTQTNTWTATGTNWTDEITSGLLTSRTHSP